jgi:DNA-binding transcriptional ArsR family regulator
VPLNPFIWTNAIADADKVVGRDEFARQVALRLKAQTNIALFGPRGTGKTSFTVKLIRELAKSHGADAPSFDTVYINLQRASSIPGFISAVRHAIDSHPSQRIRRIGKAEINAVEKELKVNLGVVQASIRGKGSTTPAEDEQLLFAQLLVLRRLSDRLVVVFDEFQKLARCPGNPLAVIRDALTGIEAENVRMLFTGSIREALELLLRNSREPLFQQAAEMALPDIDRSEFRDFLHLSFEATGKPATDAAVDLILNTTDGHPKRTQQFAWQTWEMVPDGDDVDVAAVRQALEPALLGSGIREQFDALTADDENLGRMLDAIVTSGGVGATSRPLLQMYGLSGSGAASRALDRLRKRGLIEVVRERGQYRIVDPFLVEWLRRTTPFSDEPLGTFPGDAALPPAGTSSE